MTTMQSLQAARRCGTPLIVIRTADPSGTISRIRATVAAGPSPGPVVQWDVVRGAKCADTASGDALSAAITAASMTQAVTTAPKNCIAVASRLPAHSVLCMVNLHRFASEDITVIQALLNIRDEFKSLNKCVVGLVPHMSLPAELSQDVLILDEPLPTEAELVEIATEIYRSAQVDAPTPETIATIVDATLGLAAFPAEQAMAMSITRRGMNMEELWQRKRSLIGQTPGLSVVKPTVTLNDVGGVHNAKTLMRRISAGAEPPRCFVFIDEGEKAFSGSSVGNGDSSGVSQNFLGTLLTEMQERNYSGVIFVGFPGSAKSMVAKAAGASAGVPTIQFDLAGMKNSLVGQSEANLRRALQTVHAVSQGRAYFVMTCNGIATLPPELKRRFRDAIVFFDVPDREEKDAIWALYLAQYGERLSGLALEKPDDTNWTGAEISTCVHNAWRFQVSLKEAATYIVPAFQSMGQERAQKLREEASGRFISASYPGPYNVNRRAPETVSAPSRNIQLD